MRCSHLQTLALVTQRLVLQLQREVNTGTTFLMSLVNDCSETQETKKSAQSVTEATEQSRVEVLILSWFSLDLVFRFILVQV